MSALGTPRSAGIVSRATNIVLRPVAEWPAIALEPTTVPGLFLGYAAILAAIPAIARIAHGLMPACFFGACWTPNPIFVVVGAVLYYVASLASVFLIGFIIDALASSFGGQRSQEQAMKVAVYSWTAAWLAGAFNILPWFGGLLAFVGSLYSLYLLYTGLPALMKSPADRSLGYTAVVVVLAVVVSLVVGAVVGTVSTIGMIGAAASAPGALSGTVHVGNGSVDLNRLQQSVQQLQQQVQPAPPGAAPGATGAPASGKIVAVDADKLKALLPDSIGGAPRTELTTNNAGGSALSNAEAVYSNANMHVTLTITDLGAASPLMAFAGAMNVQHDEQTTNGYDRVQTVNGQLITEKYDTPSKSGEYAIVVANRFSIDASGSGVPIDTLKSAVAAVGPDRVAGLARG
jgi:hypothetical protein